MSEIWAVPTWVFFHTIAEKINEGFLKNNAANVLIFIKLVCNNLPCPDCREHASHYLSSVKPRHIDTKEKLKDLFFTFHNDINGRLRKPIFQKKNLAKFKNGRLDVIYRLFIFGLTKKYGQTLLPGVIMRTLRRKNAGNQIKKWCEQNWASLQGF
jgi:hypothetical protein